MITTNLHKGQGLGNQLWCYAVTRVIAEKNGYNFGIVSPENFKALDFMDLDFGQKPDGIDRVYNERSMFHPKNGADITLHDPDLLRVPDNTEIAGVMQDEKYISDYKGKIREWFKIKDIDTSDCIDENTCVLNFRGGEYARHPELYLSKKYWVDAMENMLKVNQNLRFIVITDDVSSAKKMLPEIPVYHFNIWKDYAIISKASYLIISNSSFAWFPAWLSENLKYCIAPKYWGRHNISDGYWSCGYNITTGWMYQDRDGILTDFKICQDEFQKYIASHPDLFIPGNKIKKSLIKKINGRIFWELKKIKNLVSRIWSKYLYLKNSVIMKWRYFEKKLLTKTTPLLNSPELQEYRKTIKVYDVFTYNGEVDTLEIRLNILYNHVDKFVIVEAPTTFSGLKKPLYFELHKKRFTKFADKIKYFVIDDYPNDPAICALADKNSAVPRGGPKHWRREFYQKESIKKALLDLHDNDFCFIGDVDEIWNPQTVIDYRRNDVYKLRQIVYMYFLNNKSNQAWAGTTATKYKNIKNACLNDLRAKNKTIYTYVNNAGWHFTSMGGIDEIRRKLNDSYTEESYNTPKIQADLAHRFGKTDYVGRNFIYTIDETSLPEYILNNKEKYKDLLKTED